MERKNQEICAYKMIIQKKRVRKLDPYINHIKDGSKIVIGVTDLQRFPEILSRVGFLETYEKGQSLLPSPIGPVTEYNSEGKIIKHKDLPMETAYYQKLWHWKQWDGSWHSRIVDVPYERYPRSFKEPPAIELTMTENSDGKLLLVSPVFIKEEKSNEIINHVVNLFLEIFGECEILTENLESAVSNSIKRLNWRILPQGEIPWEQFKKEIEPIVKNAPKGNQPVIFYRLKVVSDLKPDFGAIGTAGFHGYIINGFTKLNIYILESMYYGNATYIFGETWEELSKKTKAEILNEKLQKARIIHFGDWENKVKEIIRGGE